MLVAESDEEVQAALAWRDGMLHFDNTSLSDAVEAFNRYNRGRLTIDDARAGEIRIGGTFKASNVEAFIRLLHDAYGLNVKTEGRTIKISS